MVDGWSAAAATTHSPWHFRTGDDSDGDDLPPPVVLNQTPSVNPDETAAPAAQRAGSSSTRHSPTENMGILHKAERSASGDERPDAAIGVNATATRRRSLAEGLGGGGLAGSAARRRGSMGEGPLAESLGFASSRRGSMVIGRRRSMVAADGNAVRRGSLSGETTEYLERQAALMLTQSPPQQPERQQLSFAAGERRHSSLGDRSTLQLHSLDSELAQFPDGRRRSVRRGSYKVRGDDHSLGAMRSRRASLQIRPQENLTDDMAMRSHPSMQDNLTNDMARRRSSLHMDAARTSNINFTAYVEQQRHFTDESTMQERPSDNTFAAFRRSIRPESGDSTMAIETHPVLSSLDVSIGSQPGSPLTLKSRRDLPQNLGRSPPRNFGAQPVGSMSSLERAQHGALQKAACTIQRVYRGRANRAATEQWIGAVTKLRHSFIDKKAEAAGALDNPLYSNSALAARDALRNTPEVIAALDEAWNACIRASGRPDATGLTREEYFVMSRKIYLAIKCLDADDDISVDDVLEAAEEDWLEDSEGKAELSEQAFKTCWFQLADVHVDDIDASEYSDWIREIITEMTMTTEAQGEDELINPDIISRIEQWRPDSDLLDSIRVEADITMREFKDVNNTWLKMFEPESIKPARKSVAGLRQRSQSQGANSHADKRTSTLPSAPRRSLAAIGPPAIKEEPGSEEASFRSKPGENSFSKPESASAPLPGRRGSSRPGSSPRRLSVTPPTGVRVDPEPGEEVDDDETILPGADAAAMKSFSRKLSMFKSVAESQTPSQMLRETGLVRDTSAAGSPRPPSGGPRPPSGGPRPPSGGLGGERRGSTRPTSAISERRGSSRPTSGDRREFTVGDWQKSIGESWPTHPSSRSSTPSQSFIQKPTSMARDGHPVGDPSTWLRPETPRDARPWTRSLLGRAPRVRFHSRALDLGTACNRLVAEISARSVAASHDTGWPVAQVYVIFGTSTLPLPMMVLFGSAAMQMTASEVGARLMLYARGGLGETELRVLCAKLAYPPLRRNGPNDYLPVIATGLPGA
jgi:hypothetical protein